MASSTTSESGAHEVLVATAGVPNESMEIFTEECLRGMAAGDSRCRYDEQTKQLWMEIQIPTNLVEEMFAAVKPGVRFVDVTPKAD